MSFTYDKAQDVIAFLRQLQPAFPRDERAVNVPGHPRATTKISSEQGDEIARYIAERGGHALFFELDSYPGRYDSRYASGDWHWKLRQARNDTSSRFFEILGGS